MYLLLLSRFLVILGALSYVLKSIMNIDVLSFINNLIIIRIIVISIGISALYFLFNRDYYLPFLGHTVMPITSSKSSENLTKIKLTGLPSRTTVIVWGSQNKETDFDNPFDAYGSYANTEITQTDENGNVTVELSCPSAYYVNKFGIMRRKLDRHIHYRYELPEYKGLFSRIYTKYLNKNCE